MMIRKVLRSVCVATGLAATSLTALAQLPVGTVALYSDGDVEKLVAYQAEHPVWEETRKRRYTLSSNPLALLLEKQDPFYPDKSYRIRLSSGDPATLQGAPVNSTESFVLTRMYQDGHITQRQWRCESRGTGRFKMKDQSLPVERYFCERFSMRKGMIQVIREQREISFAPELGLITELQRTRGGKTRTRTLKYLLSPKQATAKRIAKLHHRLIK